MVGVLDGVEGGSDDPFGCSCDPLYCCAVHRVAQSKPYRDATCQDTLNDVTEEGCQNKGLMACLFQAMQEVEALVCLFRHGRDMAAPGEVLCDVYFEELDALHPIHHHGAANVQGLVVLPGSLEVDHHLFSFGNIENLNVQAAPVHQVLYLPLVCCLVVHADEVSKLNDGV